VELLRFDLPWFVLIRRSGQGFPTKRETRVVFVGTEFKMKESGDVIQVGIFLFFFPLFLFLF